MGTGQVNKDSFEKLTESYFSDIPESMAKDCLRRIVSHYTELVYTDQALSLSNVVEQSEQLKLLNIVKEQKEIPKDIQKVIERRFMDML